MTDRKRARSVLMRARDILADRMSEMILEGESSLLEDAQGDSYMDEIATVYERVGARLAQVNAMLANLPPDAQEPAQRPAALAAPRPEVAASSGVAPAPGSPPSASAPPAATFQGFVQELARGELAAAGAILASLFGLDGQRATACVAHFQERWRREPGLLEQTMQLREELAAGRDNALLVGLANLFGLMGFEAIQVLHTLKLRFTGAA